MAKKQDKMIRVEVSFVLKINRARVPARAAGIDTDGNVLTFGMCLDPQFLDLTEVGWPVAAEQLGKKIAEALATVDWRQYVEVPGVNTAHEG